MQCSEGDDVEIAEMVGDDHAGALGRFPNCRTGCPVGAWPAGRTGAAILPSAWRVAGRFTISCSVAYTKTAASIRLLPTERTKYTVQPFLVSFIFFSRAMNIPVGIRLWQVNTPACAKIRLETERERNMRVRPGE